MRVWVFLKKLGGIEKQKNRKLMNWAFHGKITKGFGGFRIHVFLKTEEKCKMGDQESYSQKEYNKPKVNPFAIFAKYPKSENHEMGIKEIQLSCKSFRSLQLSIIIENFLT